MIDPILPLWAETAVFSALDKTLHYLVPQELAHSISVGYRVLVPLGRRQSMGMVVHISSESPPLPPNVTPRRVMTVLDSSPVLPSDLISLCRWVSRYYFYPLGEVLQTLLPAGLCNPPEPAFRALSAEPCSPSSGDSGIWDLLRYIRQKPVVTLKDIERDFPTLQNLRALLRKLEDRGAVERTHILTDTIPSPKIVKTLELLNRPKTITARQGNLKKLLEAVEAGGGQVPLSTLRPLVPNLNHWVRKLVKDGCIRILAREEVTETIHAQNHPTVETVNPTLEQQQVLEKMLPALDRQGFHPFLLFGVTGSGKTEVYMKLVEHTLQAGRSALVLVPEIALSTQLETLFHRRFGDALAVWHSSLAPSVRFRMWRETLDGRRRIVLGVRSAVFTPLAHLGLIIVDEEHEIAYKQEDRLRYNARDVAIMRADILKIPVVLGSATPSLQSFHNGISGRYTTLRLDERVHNRPLPVMETVDMRREHGEYRILSRVLQEALHSTIAAGEQALLFLNRRGFATFLLCKKCGHVVQCGACSVSMTYHQQADYLLCHYCGQVRDIPETCPECGTGPPLPIGFGTERVEEELHRILPGVATVRMDRDTVTHPDQIARCLNRMRNQEAQILIGTQMVAKGHDFPNITLAGVINADTSLQMADFRAGEATVQLLIQVAGRAGRGHKSGRVILQTYNPGHHTIQAVCNMDYESFCLQEMESRRMLQYPPYTRLLKMLVTSPHEEKTREGALELASLCRKVAREFQNCGIHVAVLGPSPAPLTRLKNRYRWHLFAKAWTSRDLQKFTEAVLEADPRNPALRRVQVSMDRDPLMTL